MSGAHKRLSVTFVCEICDESFHPYHLVQRTCGRRCGNTLISRESAAKRSATLSGRGGGRGYRKHRGRHLHRTLGEQLAGRPLATGEIVHQRDGDRSNNDLSNLEILPSQSVHASLHGRKCPPGCTCGRHKPHPQPKED